MASHIYFNLISYVPYLNFISSLCWVSHTPLTMFMILMRVSTILEIRIYCSLTKKDESIAAVLQRQETPQGKARSHGNAIQGSLLESAQPWAFQKVVLYEIAQPPSGAPAASWPGPLGTPRRCRQRLQSSPKRQPQRFGDTVIRLIANSLPSGGWGVVPSTCGLSR